MRVYRSWGCCAVALVLLLFQPLIAEAQGLLGEFRSRMTLQPPGCTFDGGTVTCPTPTTLREKQVLDIGLQTTLVLTLPKIFGTPQDFVKSTTIGFLPGLEFQAFDLRLPISELLFIRNLVAFSGRLRQFDAQTGVVREGGALTDPPVFRKGLFEFELGLGGFLLNSLLLLSNLQPQAGLEAGLIFSLFAPLPEELAFISISLFFGASEGLECLGTCTQPEELFPQGVTRPEFKFDKQVLSLEGLRISNFAFKITMESTPANPLLKSLQIETRLEEPLRLLIAGLERLLAQATFSVTAPDVTALSLKKILLRGLVSLPEEISLEFLLVDSDADLRFEQRAFQFSALRDAALMQALFFFQDGLPGSQFTLDISPPEVPEGVELLFLTTLRFKPVAPGQQEFESITFAASQRLFLPPISIRFTMVGGFSKEAGGGAFDVRIEF